MRKGVIGQSLEKSDALEFIRRSSQETPAQRERRIKRVCEKCRYHSRSDGACNYILMEGVSRPCSYVDCVEAGVFKPRAGQKNGWTAKRRQASGT